MGAPKKMPFTFEIIYIYKHLSFHICLVVLYTILSKDLRHYLQNTRTNKRRTR
uniref:Uncharacterized protein n=1 Tax=Anguilla anguilla TaxID=7936 RepID=A0A0E9XC78_ANGAN